MADKIDLIVTQDALKGLDELIKKLQIADEQLQLTAEVALNTNKAVGKISTPSGFNEFSRSQQQITNNLQQQTAAVGTLTTARNRLNTATAVEIENQRILAQRVRDYGRANSELVGGYQKLSMAYNQAKKEALDLGAIYGKNSVQFAEASRKANALAVELKELDSAVGVNNRNVGAYSEGISKAFGKLRLLANILPGIGLAGLFGLALDPLFNYLKGLDFIAKAFNIETEAAKASKKALEEKTKAEDADRQAVSSKQSDEIARSQILLETAKNVGNSYKQRIAAVKELQERYPEYLGSLSKEQILAGDTEKAELALNDALVKRGIALAAQQSIQEVINTQLKTEKKFADDMAAIEKQRTELGKQYIDPFTKDPAQLKKLDERNKLLTRLFYSEKSVINQHDEKQKQNEADLKFYLDQYNANSKYITSVRESKKETDKDNESKRKQIESINFTTVGLNSILPRLEAYKKALQEAQKTLSRNNEEYKKWQISIDAVQLEIDKITGATTILDKDLQKTAENATKNFIEIAKSAVDTQKAIDAAKKKTEEWFKIFSDEFVNKSGFKATFELFKDGLDGFGDDWKKTSIMAMESAQEMFTYIANLSNQHFENEKANLEKQKNIAIEYAGESTEARNKIEGEYKKKVAALDAKEAKAKQEQAIFNIVIDTAQAVMATLAQGGAFVLPLAIAMGVLGAAQIATVMAQKIPQYAQGGTHSGGLMLVNDGKGSNYQEKIITPDGRVISPNGRNVLMNAPAGTQVLTHEQWTERLHDLLASKEIAFNNNYRPNGINYSEMDDIMSRYIGNRINQNVIFDRNGFNEYISKNGNITRRSEIRGSGRGLRF